MKVVVRDEGGCMGYKSYCTIPSLMITAMTELLFLAPPGK